MENLSDDLLLDAYFQAKKLNLSADFIHLMEVEMVRRGLSNS